MKQSQHLKRQRCAIIVFGLVLLPGSWRAFETMLCCLSSFPTPNCRVLCRWDRTRIAFPLLKLSVREEMNLSSQILVHQTCASRSHSGLVLALICKSNRDWGLSHAQLGSYLLSGQPRAE